MNKYDDEYSFMHCINFRCRKKLTPPWDNYIINKFELHKGVLPIYKCPYCAAEYTINDCQVVSIPITGYNENEQFIMVKVEDNLEIVGIYDPSICVKINDDLYLHVPNKHISKNSRLFSIPKEVGDEMEMISIVKNFLKGEKS